MLIQRTVENEVWHYRASRSCSRVTARAWYDCKMAAKTYKAWLACERTLVPPYQELTEKTDTVALEPGVLYVDGEEIISITQLQEGRAILLDVDSGTDEKREIVLTTGLEIELDHHYLDGLTPEARAACIADNVCVEMGGFDLNAGLDGPPQPTHLRGPRFRVTEIDRTKQRVVLTRLSSW